MVAVSGLTRAQVNKVTFDKAVDYVNCKSVELSLNKSVTSGVVAKFQANCSCQDNPDFNNIKSAIPQTETKTIELSAEIDKVKTNEFKPSLKPDEVLKLLSENIFSNQTKYKKLFDFASKRKDDDAFASMKSELKKELEIQIASQSQANKDSQQNTETELQEQVPSLEDSLKVIEQTPETKVEEKDWFEVFTFKIDILSIIISVVIIILILKYVYSGSDVAPSIIEINKNIEKKIKDELKSIGNSGPSPSSNEVTKLNAEIKALKDEIKQMATKIENTKSTLEIVHPQHEQQTWQDTMQPEVKSEIFFLSTPNAEGSFNDSSVSPAYKEGASIYRFTIIGNKRAKFQIDEREASVKLALTYPDKSIDPVCDAVNAFNPKAKRITTVEVGHAELLNDKWIVNKTQKAKIRYES